MEVSKDGITLKADISQIGDDILIAIYGGDKPHIGSCMLNEKMLNLTNHKDYLALHVIYEILKKHIHVNICLVGGIHVENITKKQINLVLKLCEDLAKKILKYLLNSPSKCR